MKSVSPVGVEWSVLARRDQSVTLKGRSTICIQAPENAQHGRRADGDVFLAIV
jgi:hypothetical protein